MKDVSDLIREIYDRNLWDKSITASRGEYLKVRGSKDTNTYFIESGCVRAMWMDDQEEHTIRFGYTNNIIGALDSYFMDTPSPFYIQAIKKTDVKVLKKITLQTLLNESAENQQLWQQVLESLVVQQLEREIDLLTSSPQERFNRVLKRSPQLFQEVPYKYIASYLRMTPETLSRIKKS